MTLHNVVEMCRWLASEDVSDRYVMFVDSGGREKRIKRTAMDVCDPVNVGMYIFYCHAVYLFL